jgi:ubiquinone/menaquinone biosynthesis C-methylase UbiE
VLYKDGGQLSSTDCYASAVIQTDRQSPTILGNDEINDLLTRRWGMVGPQDVQPRVAEAALNELLKGYAKTYDSLAPEYHRERFLDPTGQYDFNETQILLTDLLASLPSTSTTPWSMLDVATGTGKVAVTVAQSGRSIIALDAAPGMLRQCRARAQAEGLDSHLALTAASATQLPYCDNTFACVFSFRFLHLFPYAAYPALLREMARVVKPGGYVIVEMKNRHYGGMIPLVKDSWRAYRGETNFSSFVTTPQLQTLANTVGRLQLIGTWGLLLPKGWWGVGKPQLASVFRRLNRGILKPFSAHFVAVYRKE